jgi:hypothetical protein
MSGPIRPVIDRKLDTSLRMAVVGCGCPDISSWVNAVLRAELSKPVDERHVVPIDPVYLRGLDTERDRKGRPCEVVTGQVIEVSSIRLRLSGLDDEEEAELPPPSKLPNWTLGGTVFTAELDEDVRTFDDLRQRPGALRAFRRPPRPHLTSDDLTLEPRGESND